jgi:hypothetical protein
MARAHHRPGKLGEPAVAAYRSVSAIRIGVVARIA